MRTSLRTSFPSDTEATTILLCASTILIRKGTVVDCSPPEHWLNALVSADAG
jgi:hypothetical protein